LGRASEGASLLPHLSAVVLALLLLLPLLVMVVAQGGCGLLSV